MGRTYGSDVDWVVLETVDSTNLLARRILSEVAEPHDGRPVAVLAWTQRSGRGRRGRRWESLPGQGIWASLLVTDLPADRLHSLSLLAGVSLAGALQPYIQAPVQLKWPNDLWVDRRKLGGILVDVTSSNGRRSATIGFGVNHGRTLPSLQGREATSVTNETALPPEMARLAVEMVEALRLDVARQSDMQELLTRARQILVHSPGDRMELETPDGPVAGVFRGLNDRGLLMLENAHGVQCFASAEITSQ